MECRDITPGYRRSATKAHVIDLVGAFLAPDGGVVDASPDVIDNPVEMDNDGSGSEDERNIKVGAAEGLVAGLMQHVLG